MNLMLMESALVFSLCVALLYPLMKWAPKFGLMDQPNARKRHSARTPIVGGIAIVSSVVVGLFALGLVGQFGWLLAATLLLLGCGVWDDRQDLPVSLRLVFQLAAGLMVTVGGGVVLENLGQLIPGVDVSLGIAAVPFTVFCVLGVINAVNMIDGVDGLCGSLMVVSLLTLSGLVMSSADGIFLSAVVAALVAFLFYNAQLKRSSALVFLGDAGSTVLGLWIVYFLLKYTQGDAAPLSPIGAAWCLGIPLIDTVSVIVKRFVQRRSIFSADRGHIHHWLLDRGLSANQVVAWLTGLQFLMGGVALWISRQRDLETMAFWCFVALIVLSIAVTANNRLVDGEAPARGL